VRIYLVFEEIHPEYKGLKMEESDKGGMRIGKTPKKLASICCP
jgi:hypothetical protein